MIVAAAVALLLSLYLATVLLSNTLLNKIAKASMGITLILSFAMLMAALGYVKIDQTVQEIAILFAVASFVFVGTMLNTHGRLLLITSKLMCFTVSALFVFNVLLVRGLVSMA
jgi:hypothetical protein